MELSALGAELDGPPASAAQRQDVVLTSDLPDLQRLTASFPGVRILAV